MECCGWGSPRTTHLYPYCKVFLVIGGQIELRGEYLDSTELLTEGASHWVEAGALPSARSHMAAVSLLDKIILTGTSNGTAVFTLY